MIKRYNYTGRKKLPQKAIRIQINDDNKFEVTWQLDDFGMPASGAVYVEAFSSGSLEVSRYSYGTVGTPNPDASSRLLSGVSPEVVAFTFKVVDETDKVGRLLGVSKNIKPVGDEDDQAGQQSILPVNPIDLGDQVWKLNFTHERPYLEVNSRIPDIMNLIKEDRKIFSLVYPAAIRQIFNRILVHEDWDDPDGDSSDWRAQWLKWGIHWHSDKERPVQGEFSECSDAWDEWIENIADSFCKKHRIRDKFTNLEVEEVQ